MRTGEAEALTPELRAPARATDYLAMARPDHWPKHVFIVPGIVLASILHPRPLAELWMPLVIGFVSAAAVASANYVLNEWLDAERDAFHPKKRSRPAVTKSLSPGVVWAEYAALVALGLALALVVSKLFFLTSCLFLASGWLYNVPPVRTKDRAFLDVTSEAINNPIRLTLGWAMVDATTLPPSSLLLAYWMGGAFLMALKRFAEYRSVSAAGRLEALKLYRRSFAVYSQRSLLLLAFLCAQMAAFFLAVFLIKYRIEYLLSLPFFALVFVDYLKVALREESPAQAPEKLFREKTLLALLALLIAVLGVLTWVDIPSLERLTDPHYIELPFE
ncbi:MAG: UbiA family prenyltransferase [Thermoanaerobaculia bacterium]